MNTIRNAGHYVSAKTKGNAAAASKETNKQIAKDHNVPISTRIKAAGDALHDKIESQGHHRRADVHKQAAKHNY